MRQSQRLLLRPSRCDLAEFSAPRERLINLERESTLALRALEMICPAGRAGPLPGRLRDRVLSDGGDLQPNFETTYIDALSSHRVKSLDYENDELTDSRSRRPIMLAGHIRLNGVPTRSTLAAVLRSAS